MKLNELFWHDASVSRPARSCKVIIVAASGYVTDTHYHIGYNTFNVYPTADDDENRIDDVLFWAYWEV